MLKFLKKIIILILFLQSPLYSKTSNNNDFNSKDFSNYFSALISYNNQKNLEALKFFNLSKNLINDYDPYLKKYVFSLVLEGKVKKAIKEINKNINNNNSDFFESYLLLFLDSVKKNNIKKSSYYLEKLSKFKDFGTLELVVYESLKNYLYVFENKQWNTDSIVKIEAENIDTSFTYDLYAMIRHTTNYRFQNLFLFTEIQGKKDTLEISLSEKNGKWNGRGFGDVKELKIKIANNIRFSQGLMDDISFEQAMRCQDLEKINELQEILAIGITIQKNE